MGKERDRQIKKERKKERKRGGKRELNSLR